MKKIMPSLFILASVLFVCLLLFRNHYKGWVQNATFKINDCIAQKSSTKILPARLNNFPMYRISKVIEINKESYRTMSENIFNGSLYMDNDKFSDDWMMTVVDCPPALENIKEN